MDKDLKCLVSKSKNGDKDCLMEIIERFTPLLKKYSKNLSSDEVFSDLEITLIETIKAMPLKKHSSMKEEQIVAYINKAIKSKYIKLSKKNKLIANREIELNLDIAGIDYMDKIERKNIIYSLMDKLTSLQKEIIIQKFIYGYSEVEIAKKLHVSKQAVNKSKKRALETLKGYLCT